MTESGGFDVFISYATEDSGFVAQLVSALEAEKLKVWYDRGELRIGDSFLRRIEDALEHSRFYLLVLSPAFFQRSWAQFEAGVALTRVGKQHVLPIYLGVEDLDLKKFAPTLANTMGIRAAGHTPSEIASMVKEVVLRDAALSDVASRQQIS